MGASEATNEAFIRKAYQIAEARTCPDGEMFHRGRDFTDESIGVTYRGASELGRTVEIYATAFPEMHRELYRFFSIGDIVVAELALQERIRGRSSCPWEPSRQPAGG